MNPSHSSYTTQFKVGIFTILTLVLVGAMTVFVNDKPFWWRSCEYVKVSVDDATGLKAKSPVKSLGLQIGYLKTVELSETTVKLGVCITAPVEVLPDTRAYLRGEGFLGDKFLELKPVRYIGSTRVDPDEPKEQKLVPPAPEDKKADKKSDNGSIETGYKIIREARAAILGDVAYAEDAPTATAQAPAASGTTQRKSSTKEIPVGNGSADMQHLIGQADTLVSEITKLTKQLQEAINPKQIQETMTQLNKTLENASKTLSPESGLTATAQRALSKLEDAIEQVRDMMTRVNRGEGSVGMIINDPSYAEELKEAIRNVNRLLSRVSGVRFNLDLALEKIPAYDGTRAVFRLGIFPQPDRYYLLGLSLDPRGNRKVTTTTTEAGGITSTTKTTTVEESGILLTGMLGKVLWRRFDVSAGILNGDGAVSGAFRMGPYGLEDRFQLRADVYSRGQGFGIEERLTAILRPAAPRTLLGNLYVRGGLETLKKVGGSTAYFYGAGITFDDDDIKLLFAFK